MILRCHFCGSTKIRVPLIGICASMGGDDYSFCNECLKGMSADQFWRQFLEGIGYLYPPKFSGWAQEAVDQGVHPNEAMYSPVKQGWGTISTKTSKRNDSKPKAGAEKERRKMTNSLRYKIMRRDSFHCVLCGATGKDDFLVVDHILPIAKGGKTIDSNLRTLCTRCNSGKGVKLDDDKLRETL